MADRSIVNALAEEPQRQPTLADVVRNFLAAPRMQQFGAAWRVHKELGVIDAKRAKCYIPPTRRFGT